LAQPDSDGLEHGWREFGAWVAVSWNSAKAEVADLGQVSFGGFYILGLRYGRVLAAGRVIALVYVLDLVPAAVVTEIPGREPYYERYRDTLRGWVFRQLESADWGTVYGLGISPIGLRACVLPRGRLKLCAGGTAGFLVFARDVPVPRSQKFNFRFEADIGLQLAVAPGWGLTLGIGLQHVSSGTPSVPNPGLDYQVLRLGVSATLRDGNDRRRDRSTECRRGFR
jgi:hypothetical protein